MWGWREAEAASVMRPIAVFRVSLANAWERTCNKTVENCGFAKNPTLPPSPTMKTSNSLAPYTARFPAALFLSHRIWMLATTFPVVRHKPFLEVE